MSKDNTFHNHWTWPLWLEQYKFHLSSITPLSLYPLSQCHIPIVKNVVSLTITSELIKILRLKLNYMQQLLPKETTKSFYCILNAKSKKKKIWKVIGYHLRCTSSPNPSVLSITHLGTNGLKTSYSLMHHQKYPYEVFSPHWNYPP